MFTGKYKYTETEQKNLLSSVSILVDTREKKNDHIIDYFDKCNIKWKSKALEQGDYTFFVPQNDELTIPRDIYFNDEIIIERKGSLDELAGNLTTNRDRFEKELSLAKAKTRYLMIENASYEDVLSGNYKSDYSSKSFVGSLHSFNHKYNLQVVFMPNKLASGAFIYATMYYYFRNLIK